MYLTLLILHSAIRWLVVASLLYAIYMAYKGYTAKLPFTKHNNIARHGTATIAHIQLTIGILLYTKSPIVKGFLLTKTTTSIEPMFFGIVHITLMVAAIVIITIGSSMAKRKPTDALKHKTMLLWFAAALLLIVIAIPWPFSPLAQRPYIRLF
jgi:uncharacterized membrane protein YozB (DUF420 family)